MTEPCDDECGQCGSSPEHRPPPTEHSRVFDISASQRGKEGSRNDVAVAEKAVTGGGNKSPTRHSGYFRRHRVPGDRIRGQQRPNEKCKRSCNDAHYDPRRTRTPCVDAGSEAHETGKADPDADPGEDASGPLLLVALGEDRHRPRAAPDQHESARATGRNPNRNTKEQ